MLGHGPNIEVIEPEDVRAEMKALISEMEKLYI